MLALILQLVTLGQEPDAGIVYGDDFSFMVTAPKDWVLDNSGKNKPPAVFYSQGGSWDQSPTVIYVNPQSRKEHPKETLQQFVARDRKETMAHDPSTHTQTKPLIATKDGRTAIVVEFTSKDPERVFEEIAYIQVPKAEIVICLTSKDVATGRRNHRALESVVKSFADLGVKVKTKGT